jgi:hypothetical protein
VTGRFLLSSHDQHSWLVIEPDVRGVEWNAFASVTQLIKAGEDACGSQNLIREATARLET